MDTLQCPGSSGQTVGQFNDKVHNMVYATYCVLALALVVVIARVALRSNRAQWPVRAPCSLNTSSIRARLRVHMHVRTCAFRLLSDSDTRPPVVPGPARMRRVRVPLCTGTMISL